MTVFANQNSNLVFASPDGTSGSPDFRPLTANDLPVAFVNSGLGADIAISSTNRTTDTYLLASNVIKANTLHAGDSYKITVIIEPNDTAYAHLTVRLGPNANINDTHILYEVQVANNVMNGTQNSDPEPPVLVGPFLMYNTHVVVKSTGNNANVIAYSDLSLMTGHFNPSYASETIIDSTVDNYLGVSFYKSNLHGAATNDAIVKVITFTKMS